MVFGIEFGGPWQDVSLLLLRIVLAQIFIIHGVRKIVKKESDGTPKYIFLGFVEAIAGFLILFGFLTFFASLFYIAIMFGALFLKLFVWKGQTYVSNMEYDVLILLASLVILVFGPGSFILSF